MSVLDQMEQIRPKGVAHIPAAIDELMKFSKSKDLLCLFTDLLDLSDELLKKLNVWQLRGGEVIVFQVLHDDEIELPSDLSSGEFIDSEVGDRVRVDVPSIRDNYRKEMSQFIGDCRKKCVQQGFGYNLVRTSESYTKVLQQYFARRVDRLATRSNNLGGEKKKNDGVEFIGFGE